MDSAPPSADPSPAPATSQHRGWGIPRLGNVAAVLLSLVPFGLVVWLVETYFVNIPFYDDFTFVEDWVKYQNGQLHLGELFSAHMEHRVTVPRLLALAMHAILGKNLIWQSRLTLLLLLGMGWNLAALLCRGIGQPLRRVALPLFAISALLFCAIQWQALLWAIMFEVFIPLYCITLVLRIWFAGKLSMGKAFAISLVCSMASAWSFGTGLLLFPLTALAIWFGKTDLPTKERLRWIGAWLGCALVAGILYSLNPQNAVPPQFAYNQGHEVTVGHALSTFSLSSFTVFMTGILGCHLSRGLHLPNIQAAEWIGAVSLLLFVLAAFLVWRLRRVEGLVKTAAPWLLLGLFSIGTAGLIALGRSRLTVSNALAVTGRYVCHAVPLTIALVALAFILGRHFSRSRTWLSSTGGLAAGLLLMLTGMEWVYGSRLMELWSMARWQDSALVLFTNVFPTHEFLGPDAGDGEYGAKWIQEMNRLHLLPFTLLEGSSPQQPPALRVSSRELRHRLGKFERFERRTETGKDGKAITRYYAAGYCQLPDSRPADLVIFTTGSDPATAKIFALGTLDSLPQNHEDFTKRDHEFIPMAHWQPELTARWVGFMPLSVIAANVPEKDEDIDAWAFDVRNRRLYHIQDGRTQPSPRLPKGVAPGPE